MKIYLLTFCLICWAVCAQSAENLTPMPADHKMSMGKNMAAMVHDHQPIMVPAGAAIPQLEIKLYRDKMTGFNLHLRIANFNIEPPEFESENGPVINGHAHLYINGEKIRRIYGRYTHLPKELFKPGVNMVMVSLNAHNHDVWTYDNKQIMASMAIARDEEKFSLANFASFPI